MRQNSIEADITALNMLTSWAFENFFIIIFFIITYSLWKQNLFQKSLGHMTWKLLKVARKCIAITWMSDSQLYIGRCFSEMNSCVPLEKITYTIRKDYDTFIEMWQPYLAHRDTSSANVVVVGLGLCVCVFMYILLNWKAQTLKKNNSS